MTIEDSGIYADIAGSIGQSLAMSTTAAQTSPLTEGLYDVSCTVDVFVQVSNLSTTVTTSNGYQIYAGMVVTIKVPEGFRLSGILASGTATLKYHKVGD